MRERLWRNGGRGEGAHPPAGVTGDVATAQAHSEGQGVYLLEAHNAFDPLASAPQPASPKAPALRLGRGRFQSPPRTHCAPAGDV